MAQTSLKKIILTLIVIIITGNVTFAKGTFEVIKSNLDLSSDAELTKLQDGRVLISEFDYLDFSSQLEIYDPKTKTIKILPPPKVWHSWYTKPIVLDDGKVLLVGHWCGKSNPKKYEKYCKESMYAEIYDPETNTYELVGKILEPLDYFEIAKLKNGKVLIFNGIIKSGDSSIPDTYVKRSEIYDPETKKFSFHAETSLDIRAKLARVGENIYYYQEYIEKIKDKLKPVYPEGDIRNRLPGPKVEFFEIPQPHGGKSILLENGELLVLGIHNGYTEIYSPVTAQFRRVGNMHGHYSSEYFFSNKFPGEKYYVMGDNFVLLEMYDSKTENFVPIHGFPVEVLGGWKYRSLALPNGKILVYGGFRSGGGLSKSEYFVYKIQLCDFKTKTVEVIDKIPRYMNLGKSISLDDGSVFILAWWDHLVKFVIYRNDKLLEGDTNDSRNRK